MLKGSMHKRIAWALAALIGAPIAQAQTDVLMSRTDLARTGQSLNEPTLTAQSVASATFGKIYSFPVDGQAYAQPLVKANLTIAGKGTFNTVFVATEQSSIYAVDADSGTPIWHRNFTNPATGLTARPATSNLEDIQPVVSITSTPVIDAINGTLYVVAETVQSGSTAYYWLHALDVTTGADKVTPVRIQASVGNGLTPLNITAATSQQRPGLIYLNGVVYAGFGSNGDNFPWVGWVVGYDGTTLAQVTVFCTSPSGAQGGGVWMGGAAPAVDSSGNMFLATGNGHFTAGSGWGNAFLKLSTSGGLAVADYFAPFNQAALGDADQDVGSGGVTVLPNGAGSAAHPNLLVGTDKDGEIYLIDRNNMGHYNGSYTAPQNSNVVQWISGQVGGTAIYPTAVPLAYAPNMFATPAYWQNRVYLCGAKDHCKLFTLANGLLSTTPVSQTSTTFGYPGTQPVISAASSSATAAILWGVERNNTSNASVLHAYDATNLATELYNSTQAANNRDAGAAPLSFAVPTVANGKVFVATQSTLDVYGVLAASPQRLAAPTFAPTPSSYAGTQSVTISAPSGARVYYTLDGTLPTLSSPVYTAPLSISTTSTITAMAVQSGALTSAVVSGTYTITPGQAAQIRYVQGSYATPQSPQGSVAVKYTAAQQQGDLNVVVVGWNDSVATVKSVTDTSGNTYALAVGPTVMSGIASQSIYYASNIPAAAASGNTVTVAFNSPATYADIRIAEYGGVATAAALDVTASGSGTGTSASSGLASTRFANDLLVGADLTVTGTTTGSGFTQRMLTVPDADLLEDRIVTAVGSYAATAGIAPSGQWIMQLAAFKAAVSGTPPPTPTAPSGLTATAAGATGINLAWTAASESGGSIAQYLIERCQGAGCSNFAQIATSTATSYADASLNGSTSYSYRVRAKDAAGNTGPYSNTASATTGAAVPGVPTNLAAVASGSMQVNLSWGAASETGGTVSSYLIERCQGAGCSSFAQIGTATTLTYGDTGLSGSTTYSYRVRAKDTAGSTGAYSNVATVNTAAPTLTAPGSLTATSASANQINLSWSAATETGGTISAYLIERCQGAGCSTFSQIASTGLTSYNDAALTAATSYAYRVHATDAGGDLGPYSGVATATTASGSQPVITFVQANYATPQTPQTRVTVAYAAAQAAGDLNVVVVGWNDSTALVGTVSDSAGNTYQLAAGPTVISGTASQAIYYAANIVQAAAGNKVTVTFSTAAVYPDIRILEYGGIATTGALDVVASGSGNSTSSASAVVTTTNANDLLVGANLVLTGTTGPGAGFTRRLITDPDGDIAEDRVVTATGSYSATAPISPAAPWIMQLAAFRRHP